jgi:hypothetical protein
MMTKRFIYLLDSGAYSVWRKGDTISLEKYAEFVVNHSGVFRGGAFNLDFIDPPKSSSYKSQSAEKSYENWLELRRMGAETIPVYHIGDDENGEYLKKYMDKTDYIGLGAIAKLDSNSRTYGLDHIWNSIIKNPDGTPRCRIHGLGLTSTSIMLRYPWFSVDSTRTIALAAYGGIMLPKLSGDGSFDYTKPWQICVSNQSRDQTIGKMDSFFGTSKLVQRLVREYCELLGYELDTSLEGRILKPKMTSRKKKDPIWTEGLGFEASDLEAATGAINEKNLSALWVPRFILNMHVMNEFVKAWRAKGKTIRIYNVVGGGNVFETFAKGCPSEPAARCLVSYARMNDSFLNRLVEVARAH